MFNFDYITKEDIPLCLHYPNQPQVPDQPYKIISVGGSGSIKANALLNLINHEPDIDKIYLYAKDPFEAKHQLLINERESTAITHFNNSKSFIEFSNDMYDIVFGDMIAGILINKKLNPIVTELFIREKKTKYFYCFHHTILFCCSEKNQTKFSTLFRCGNSK